MDQNQNTDKTNKRDTGEIKKKILSAIARKGPSLPVHIAREIGSDMLFTSAFLSELVSDKKLKLSHMRVGNSPLYLVPGQESQLENFTEYLNHKEKEALELLKKEGTLEDSKQEPSIRVALRSLRDFAKPFKKPDSDEIFWTHVNVDEKDVKGKEIEEAPKPKEDEEDLGIFDEEKSEEKSKEDSEEKESEKKDEKDKTKLPEKPKEKIKVKERKKVRKKSKTSSSKTKKEKFFDKVKSYLDGQGIALKDIVGFGRGRISLIVEINGKKKFLMAYNKKRINETDIGRASKGAKKHNLPYVVLSKGGPLKRIESLKKDLENLSGFQKF